MASNQLGAVVQTLRRTVLPRDGGPDADDRLLDRFVRGGDQAAFEALVRRHGPMVMGVCRRIVQHAQDAEDAFQATFLILARKAGSLARRDLLSGWLYGVAYRVARRARTMAARRQMRERPYVDLAGKDGANGVWSDLEPLLDQELQRLPKSFQLPILLCDLQGKSRREAAQQLRLPEGTLSSRLARGRELLRARLMRRGIALGAGALAVILAREATAAVPAALAGTTARLGAAFALTSETAAVPAKVLALVEAGFKSLLLAKLHVGAAALLLATLAAGAWLVAPAETHTAPAAVAAMPMPAVVAQAAPQRVHANAMVMPVADDAEDEQGLEENDPKPPVVNPPVAATPALVQPRVTQGTEVPRSSAPHHCWRQRLAAARRP